jgi:heterodisulfide reductase subunit C
MTIRITKQKATENFLKVVQATADVNLSSCYQCKKCSIGCPVADQINLPPSEIIRSLQLGAGAELLNTDLIWTCLACETCYTRCPNRINFPAVIDALKLIALKKGAAKPEGDAPLFNRFFLNTVKSYGRVYELLAIAMYKLGTGKLKQDMGKFPVMLKKGKIAILPPSGGNKDKIKRIFSKSVLNKGTEK